MFNDSESDSYLGPRIWEQILNEIKNEDSLVGVKKEIKTGNPSIVLTESAKLLWPR